MVDEYDLDFLAVGDKTSGDAIFIRTKRSFQGQIINLVDGGYSGTAENIILFMKKWYDTNVINNMILTHGDKDHISGLLKILEAGQIEVERLWALFPWDYADDLINGGYFQNRNNVKWLQDELKRLYPLLSDLEVLAKEKEIPISTPFTGCLIGEFRVLSPTIELYLDNIASSTKTAEENKNRYYGRELFESTFSKVRDISTSLREWGFENFTSENTSPENNNSVIQFATLKNQRVLLTGDAGVEALGLAINNLPQGGKPMADIFQVPHHGSRRNLSSELLDAIIGDKFATRREAEAAERLTTIISAGKNDVNHPRKAVVRALYHRGAKIFDTKKGGFHKGTSTRDTWKDATLLTYPLEIEN
ncbi:TPA: competence protein ComEC [Yersinia enterocolitica]|nr:competence protein ComEC [Yersinia enterocolitica]HDL8412190.1 competence protein ComEC [Yersinia enterocolitica]HDM8285645.1 competence protein ComEC [Yersinia enterocolitica]HEI6792385.1 competence protein ComEC [Yersinia enterocolitica]HEI6810379.1 competence protein ComEC [Yersinia enterocolitica]